MDNGGGKEAERIKRDLCARAKNTHKWRERSKGGRKREQGMRTDGQCGMREGRGEEKGFVSTEGRGRQSGQTVEKKKDGRTDGQSRWGDINQPNSPPPLHTTTQLCALWLLFRTAQEEGGGSGDSKDEENWLYLDGMRWSEGGGGSKDDDAMRCDGWNDLRERRKK